MRASWPRRADISRIFFASSYMSGLRSRLYLFDITAAPFTVTLNTAWNTNQLRDKAVPESE